MRKLLIILYSIPCLFSTSIAHAIHLDIYDNDTIEYCGRICAAIPSLEVGSTFSFHGILDADPNADFPDDVLTTLHDFSIQISGSSDSLLLNSTNTSLISSNIFTTTDEYEQTTIIGGTANFNTTYAFAALAGIPSEIIYNFDDDSIQFFLGNELTASTTVVPVPNAFILLFSGALLLTSFARKKSRN